MEPSRELRSGRSGHGRLTQGSARFRLPAEVARVVALVVVLGLVVAVDAFGTVKRVSLTTPMVAGSYASLTVNVTPKARCTVEVIYDTVVSSAKGLGRKTGGTITWRWRVGTSTHPGRWPIIVRCGKSGTFRTKLRVLPR